MQSIALYLEKFRALEPADSAVKRVVAAAVKQVVGLDIDKAALAVRGRTVYIALPASERAEVYMRREEITTCAGALLTRGTSPEIR